MVLGVILIFLIIYLSAQLFIRQESFGKLPEGAYKTEINESENYRENQFQNISVTPDLTDGANYYSILKDFIFGKSKRAAPQYPLPSGKIDLSQLKNEEDVLVWFGHSSYFLQIDKKKILVDPVFSGNASPLSFTTKSFKGTDVYSTDDIPEIDYLFISHDHWDHLDYKTIKELQPKIKNVICGLGVSVHLQRWGYPSSKIIEKDWNEKIEPEEGFIVHTTSARHFSGRGFKRNQSLWLSYVLQTPSMKIFLGGDSGYDKHFKEIGKNHGPFDLAILECGQYNKSWKHIHMMPEEVVQAAIDLNATKLFPVHWSKFTLALHAWDDSIIRVTKEAERLNVPIMHPLIGEAVNLKRNNQFEKWWEGIN